MTDAVTIGPRMVVVFHYSLRDEAGNEIETSRGSDPTAYLHGANNILPGLEAEMSGRVAGDVFSATLPPDQGYGPRQDGREQRVPVKHLLFKGKLRPGMVVHLNTSEGRRPVTVVKAGKFSADVDTNHPLAGQTLSYDIEIMAVRPASPEEASHGHAHGPGGHHH